MNFDIEIDGLDGIQEEIERAIKDAGDLEDEGGVPPEEIFTPSFMKEYTESESISKFFDECPWEVETEGDIEKIPDNEFDEYVRENTQFDSWESMYGEAAEAWIHREL